MVSLPIMVVNGSHFSRPVICSDGTVAKTISEVGPNRSIAVYCGMDQSVDYNSKTRTNNISYSALEHISRHVDAGLIDALLATQRNHSASEYFLKNAKIDPTAFQAASAMIAPEDRALLTERPEYQRQVTKLVPIIGEMLGMEATQAESLTRDLLAFYAEQPLNRKKIDALINQPVAQNVEAAKASIPKSNVINDPEFNKCRSHVHAALMQTCVSDTQKERAAEMGLTIFLVEQHEICQYANTNHKLAAVADPNKNRILFNINSVKTLSAEALGSILNEEIVHLNDQDLGWTHRKSFRDAVALFEERIQSDPSVKKQMEEIYQFTSTGLTSTKKPFWDAEQHIGGKHAEALADMYHARNFFIKQCRGDLRQAQTQMEALFGVDLVGEMKLFQETCQKSSPRAEQQVLTAQNTSKAKGIGPSQHAMS